jgi:hypothetical protein
MSTSKILFSKKKIMNFLSCDEMLVVREFKDRWMGSGYGKGQSGALV